MVTLKRFSAENLRKTCFAAFTLLAALIVALNPLNADCQSGTVHHYSSPGHKNQKISNLAAQPISGAHVYWFSMGTNGYGSIPISMISPSANGAHTDANGSVYVLGDSQGNFSISSWIACPSPSAPMYVLSVQGDPGTGQNNPYISLAAVIPTACGVSWSIDVTETSTVAAAYALNSFAYFPTDSFATDSNSIPALQSAVAYSSSLINTSNGVIPGGSAWEKTLNTIADFLAACVDSTGTTACSTLFTAATPPSGTAPVDTLQAALDIASNPTLNLSGLFSAIPPSPPFQPTLNSLPTNWILPGSSIQITAITPQPAPVGATVTIGGSGFGASQGGGTLVIGGIQASITSWSDAAIVGVVPGGAATDGFVQVFQNGSSSNAFPFKIRPFLIPSVTGISLSHGPPQMGFVITGTNFGSIQGRSTATLGASQLTVLSWSNNAITADVPLGASSGDIVITVGLPSFPVSFTVTTPFQCVP